MALAFPYDFASKTAVTGAELQAQFAAVGNALDAGLTTANISPLAGILSTQLSVAYEHIIVPLTINTVGMGAAWPGGNVYVAGATLPGTTAEGNWACTGVNWVCTDIGGGTGTFQVDWARYFGGAWTVDQAILNAATVVGAVTGTGVLAGVVTSLALPFNAANGPSALLLKSVGGDATMLVGGAAYDFLTVSVRLTRIINNGAV